MRRGKWKYYPDRDLIREIEHDMLYQNGDYAAILKVALKELLIRYKALLPRGVAERQDNGR